MAQQELILDQLKAGKAIYVFSRKGKYTFSYQKDTGALYLTLSVRALLRKDKVRIEEGTEYPWDDHIGIVKLTSFA